MVRRLCAMGVRTRTKGGRTDSCLDSRPSKASRAESESTPKAKRTGLSYREQKEWAKMEQRILQAEETIAACQAAVEDPAIASNAAALQERSEALDAARTAAERLYNRWTELEGKQTQSTAGPAPILISLCFICCFARTRRENLYNAPMRSITSLSTSVDPHPSPCSHPAVKRPNEPSRQLDESLEARPDRPSSISLQEKIRHRSPRDG